MNSAAPRLTDRPRQVTLAGTQAVAGSLIALIVLVNGMQQLYSSEVHEVLTDIVATDEAKTLGLTIEGARTVLRYSIMVMAVLSAASLVLGFFVLRRHRAARIALTVIGGSVALLCVAGGPLGWAVSAYIALSVIMLWSRPARAWFSDEPQQPGPSGPPAPPSGPGDHQSWPPSGPWTGPPPPPPPRR